MILEQNYLGCLAQQVKNEVYQHDPGALAALAELLVEAREAEQAKTDGELAALRGSVERLGSLLRRIDAALVDWAHAAGWATGHGDTPLDIIREMRSQHCDERSYADLAASGGISEAP